MAKNVYKFYVFLYILHLKNHQGDDKMEEMNGEKIIKMPRATLIINGNPSPEAWQNFVRIIMEVKIRQEIKDKLLLREDDRKINDNDEEHT
jgi:hypothetical protein